MATRTPIRTPQQAFSAYVTRHPDLAQAYAKSGSKNMGAWGAQHWDKHGSKNERRLTPHSFRYTEAGRHGAGWLTDAEQKQKNIADTMAAINAMFAGRQPYYDKYQRDIYDMSARSINERFEDIQRQNRFDLLRRGTDLSAQDIYRQDRLENKRADSLSSAMAYAINKKLERIAAEGLVQKKMLGGAGTGAITMDAIDSYKSSLPAFAATAWPGVQNIGWKMPSLAGPKNIYGFIPGRFGPVDEDDDSGVIS